tara:strand:- start:3959 stop:4435 length:477 start_codon:yes stop_codon:yes gene_type:complete
VRVAGVVAAIVFAILCPKSSFQTLKPYVVKISIIAMISPTIVAGRISLPARALWLKATRAAMKHRVAEATDTEGSSPVFSVIAESITPTMETRSARVVPAQLVNVVSARYLLIIRISSLNYYSNAHFTVIADVTKGIVFCCMMQRKTFNAMPETPHNE